MICVLIALAFALWTLKRQTGPPHGSLVEAHTSIVRRAKTLPQERGPGQQESAPPISENPPEELGDAAEVLNARLFECRLDSAFLGQALLDQPLRGHLENPVAGLAGVLVGQIQSGWLQMVVPDGPGNANLDIEGVGVLDLSWDQAAIEDPSDCQHLHWESEAVGVNGNVVDQHGHPIEDADILCSCGGRVKSDEDGAFFLTVPSETPCEVSADYMGRDTEGSSLPTKISATEDIMNLSLEISLQRRKSGLTDGQKRAIKEARKDCEQVYAIVASHPDANGLAADLLARSKAGCDETLRSLKIWAGPDGGS